MHTLTIVPLSTPCSISLHALQACRAATRLFVLTEETPCLLPLKEAGIPYESMDALYEQAEDFDELATRIAARLVAAAQSENTVYAVPGRATGGMFPVLKQHAETAGISLTVLPGTGYAEAAVAAAAPWCGSYLHTPAAALGGNALNPSIPLAVEEVDTALRAGEIKLLLQEYYPDAHEVFFCSMAADGSYSVEAIPLFMLDRQRRYHAATVLLAPPAALLHRKRFSYTDLLAVMQQLRAPGGCPWDREQTHESLKKNFIEECYEVLDAIDKQDDAALCEELGDVLLQCVFHAEIAREQGRFNAMDVSTAIVQKLIYRHPHIFAAGRADTAEEVVTKWEELKKAEKHFQTQSEVLQAVPQNLPALMRAHKVQKKAAQVGFDWDHPGGAFLKLEEECAELNEQMQVNGGGIAEEMGDVLFAAVNVARLLGLDAEELLQRASDKFIRRFTKMEALACKKGLKLTNLTLAELDTLWEEIKTS